MGYAQWQADSPQFQAFQSEIRTLQSVEWRARRCFIFMVFLHLLTS